MSPQSQVPAGTYRRFFEERIRFLRRGASVKDSIGMLRVWAYLHLRLGRLGRVTRHIPARRRPPRFDIRLDDGTNLLVRSCDMFMFEVFAYDEYDVGLERLGPVRSVLDLGANVGFATVYLARRFPGARFVCVEPSPDSFEILQENLRRNVADSEAIQAAVVATEGSYHVEEDPNPGLTTVVPGPADDGSPVEALMIEQVLDRAGLHSVDLMKLDIEGGERALLDRAGEWAHRVGSVLAEIHPPLTVREAQEMIGEHGFERLDLHDDPLFNPLLFAKASSRPT